MYIVQIQDKWTNNGAVGEVGTGYKAGLTSYMSDMDANGK